MFSKRKTDIQVVVKVHSSIFYLISLHVSLRFNLTDPEDDCVPKTVLF